MIKKLTILTATMFACFGVFSQQAIAQQIDASKDPTVVLMQSGTVTTCNALFYDTGGPTGNYSGNENHYLVFVPETSGARIKVTFEEFEVENYYDKLKIYNGSSPIDPLLAELTGSNLPTEPFYGDNPTGTLAFNFTSDGSVHKAGWKATVECYLPVPNNLVAVRLSGSFHATVNDPKTVPFVIINKGTAAITGTQYTVQLQDSSNNILAISSGVDLAPGVQTSIDIIWTPTTAGTIDVKGVVVFPSDEAPGDNVTPLVTFTVHPAGTYIAQVGPGATVWGVLIPFDFSSKHGYTQSIYTAEQIGIGGGTINSIVYKNNFPSISVGTRGIKVWIGETTLTNLDGGFIDPSELTLVYDGNAEFPQGINDITINFQIPYVYNGGNLVIYTWRERINEWISPTCQFFLTNTSENRSRRRFSDSELNPLAPSGGKVTTYVPDITMFFSTAGLGGIAGNVTCEGAPAAGVTVKVVDGIRKATTDAAGHYALLYLIPGTYRLEFTKFGFTESSVEGIAVIADETVTVNATISPIPQYMVSGTVTTSDTGLPVAGAVVNFYGYEDYTDTTDATGHYSMSGVWGGGKVYEVTVDAVEGYQTYSGTVTVDNQHITDHNIIVNEFAYPVNKVTATVEGENVNVTWIPPGTIPPYPPWISWCGEPDINNGVGTSSLFTIAHRFTAEQLETLEVAGMYVTKVRFNPHEASTYKVLVWTGGSAAESGTLVHEQTVPNITLSQWNEVELTTPVLIPEGQELWYGVEIEPAGALYPAGVDAGPAVVGFGDMVKIADQTWTTLTASGLSYNWALGALVDNGKGFVTELSKLQAELEMNPPTVTAINIPSEFRLTSAKEYGETTVVENIENSASRAFVNYTLYRLVKDQPQADWTQLVASTNDTTYTDTGWGSLPAGLYQYAVVANYTNNVASQPKLSNIVAKDLEVEFTVNVTTNSGDPATGAIITLTNQDGNEEHVYQATAGETGATFPAVWKGIYDITVTKAGFEPFAVDSVVINADATYPVELIEIIVTPFNLDIQQDGNNIIFSWNNTYGATVILEAHDVWNDGSGYQMLLDADAVEYGQTIPTSGALSNCNPPVDLYDVFEYKIPVEADASCTPQHVVIDGSESIVIPAGIYDWCITNPTADPQYPNIWIASGTNGRADDYEFEENKTYHFLAHSEGSGDGITITITDNKTGRIVDIIRSGEVADEYARIGQVTSNQVSVVDNFEIGDYYYGALSHTRAFLGYTVYLDDEEVAASIMENCYIFTDTVFEGTHTFGVQAVYTSGSSPIVELVIVGPVFFWDVNFTVKNAGDGAPIEGAKVAVHNETLTTDASGLATIRLINGEYNYTVSKSGYESFEGSFVVNSANQTIPVNMITGIDGLADGFVRLYPNPVESTLTIERNNSDEAVIELYSVSGVLISTTKTENTTITLDVGMLNSGSYFIRIIGTNDTTIHRFIKQ